MDRADWHSSCKSAVEKFEIWCVQELESKQDLHKSGPSPSSNFECQICHRMCHLRIGLLVHNKSNSWWWDPSTAQSLNWYCHSWVLLNCTILCAHRWLGWVPQNCYSEYAFTSIAAKLFSVCQTHFEPFPHKNACNVGRSNVGIWAL